MPQPKRILPPVYFLVAILSMVAIHFLAPRVQLFRFPGTLLGGVLILAGLSIIFWAVRNFGLAATTIRPFEEASRLVSRGPYRRSRNPMYLSLVIMLLGIGVVLGTAWPFAVVPVFVWLIQQRFIRPEEASLERLFGEEFAEYKRQVRRWI